jgi:sulfatase modifying factor 1
MLMNMQRQVIQRWALASALVTAVFIQAPTAAELVTIEWVTVGDPGNVGETQTYSNGGTLTFGAVSDPFRIGKYEVTIQQYTDFLNAAAKSDPYALWSASMESNLRIAGISRSGESGSYSYSVIGPFGSNPAGASSPGNRPITFVSWFDAARFANWMHNGQGSGSTETGAYTLVNGQTTGTAPARNPGAQFYIPTENEWYKAAYYKGGGTNSGYWNYATQSDTAPGNVIGNEPNQANHYTDVYSVTQLPGLLSTRNYLTDVGAFTNSVGAYGTFDQSGNVFEWNDFTGEAGLSRGLRGGGWGNGLSGNGSSSHRFVSSTSTEVETVGFRLASPVAVPEPSTWAMAGIGIACAGWGAYRRRRAR